MSNLSEAININTTAERLWKLARESDELARAVAKNPMAPPDLLISLVSRKDDKELQRNLAMNPNTPVQELLILGAEFPKELINNPVFTLLLLENPRLFQEMPFDTITSILRVDDISSEYLAMAVDYSSDYILCLITNHRQAPAETLSKIVKRGNTHEESFLAAAFHVNFKDELVDAWKSLAENAVANFQFFRRILEKEEFLYDIGILTEKSLHALHEDTLISIAANPKTSENVKKRIAEIMTIERFNERFNYYVARNHNTLSDLLVQAYNSKLKYIDYSLARNPSTPVFILEKLASESNTDVQRKIYRNYNSTKSILKILYQHEDSISLSDILKNAQRYNLPPDKIYFDDETTHKFCIYLSLKDNIEEIVFKELEAVINIDIVIALARHPKTPAHIFERIYKDSYNNKLNYKSYYNGDSLEFVVQILLAKNPSVSIKILLKLVKSNCHEVRSAAIKNIQTNFANYNQEVAEFLQLLKLANNSETSPETLLQIAKDNNVSLCLAVAKNLNTPISVLNKLAFHQSGDVRFAVTENPNTSIDTLVALSQKRRGNFYIRQSAIKALIGQDLIKAGAEVAKFVSSSEPSAPRFIFLMHQLAPSEFLAKYANSTSWLERYAVAQNPNTPKHIRKKLATDVNRIVQAAAHKIL
jgi:hypothetical protein